MRPLAPLVVLALAVAGCGGGTSAVADEVAAATFLVDMPASGLVSVERDRPASSSGAENRLDVIRPEDFDRLVVYASTPIPEPFEFVRDPLSAGGLDAFLAGVDRVLAVVYPLIEPTPGGRVLSGVLIGLDRSGRVVRTDWNDDGDARITALLEWGHGRGLTVLDTLELAVWGLGGLEPSPEADEAAGFLQ